MSNGRSHDRRYAIAATVTVVAILLACYFAFAKLNPFADHFEVRGVFTTANQLKPGNPVRLAGMDIGEVTEIERGPGDTATVTMRLAEHDDLHANATFAIQPRLLFEGNFYVKVNPGTPASGRLREDATIPLRRTRVPVQLDQVLNVLSTSVRGSLKRTFGELSDGLGTDPATGESGFGGLRGAVRELGGALDGVTDVARAAQGTRPGDLHRAIGSSSDVAAQLAADPRALADMVTNFNRTFGALAADDRALAASVAGLDQTLAVAPASLASIDRALPSVDRFGAALRPALRAMPGTLRPTNALLGQIGGLMADRELPALLRRLRPVTAAMPTMTRRLRPLFGQLEPAMRCVATRVVPTLEKTIDDGPNSSGRPVWQDIIHTTTALAGTSPNFDGNGTTIRLGVSAGETSLVGQLPSIGKVVGIGGGDVLGVRPTWLGYGVAPPLRPDQPCVDQQPVDLQKRSLNGPPAGMREVEAPRPSTEQATFLRQLISADTKAERSALLKRLLAALPQPRKPRAAEPEPRREPKPATPTPTSAPTEQPDERPAPPKQVAPTVGDALKGLLGGDAKPTPAQPQGGGLIDRLLGPIVRGGR